MSQPDNNTTGSGVLLGLFLHLLQIYGGMVFHAEPFLVFVAMWVTQFAYILPAIVVVAALKKWEMLKGLLVVAGLTLLISGGGCGVILTSIYRDFHPPPEVPVWRGPRPKL